MAPKDLVSWTILFEIITKLVLISLCRAGWIEITYLLTTPSDLTDDHELIPPIEDEYRSTLRHVHSSVHRSVCGMEAHIAAIFVFDRRDKLMIVCQIRRGREKVGYLDPVLLVVDLTSAEPSRCPSFLDIRRGDKSVRGRPSSCDS